MTLTDLKDCPRQFELGKPVKLLSRVRIWFAIRPLRRSATRRSEETRQGCSFFHKLGL
ncbi:hypothetical protein PILCRDRAFT_817034 [Piloderma croceum F 1598]|uniref:Uncharacterized protein n=1 Tax=Piloderma croceum (strain F 1598) TaxID=765440 RepID=A0A0C3G1U0_PILCF|nr:hypothetical protein PILCRDRAFT_817034 [Piloderma croceum F 1598]